MNSQLNLNTFVLNYFYQSIMNGNINGLNELGLNSKDIKLLMNYPASDINNIFSNRRINLIKNLELDRDALNTIIAYADNSNKENELIERLIFSGGSYNMLNHFFGIQKKDFSAIRKTLRISSRGRSKSSLINERYIFTFVNRYIKNTGKNYCNNAFHQCNALLFAHKNTSDSLESIWRIIDDAERRGKFNWIR